MKNYLVITNYDPAKVLITIGGQTMPDSWWATPDTGRLWRDLDVVVKPRGRWIVQYDGEDGTRGRRFSSLSRARRFARGVGGFVRRYRARGWITAPVPSWGLSFEMQGSGDVFEGVWQAMNDHTTVATPPQSHPLSTLPGIAIR